MKLSFNQEIKHYFFFFTSLFYMKHYEIRPYKKKPKFHLDSYLIAFYCTKYQFTSTEAGVVHFNTSLLDGFLHPAGSGGVLVLSRTFDVIK